MTDIKLIETYAMLDLCQKVKKQTWVSGLDGLLVWLGEHTKPESSQEFNTAVATIM